MLIKRLEVKGFKSLRDVVWEPGPLTVVIGPNGSGKTNLLYTLDLLKHSSTGTLEDAIQRIGGVHSVFWDSTETDVTLSALLDISRTFAGNELLAAEYIIGLRTFFWNNSYDIIFEQLKLNVPNQEQPTMSVSRNNNRGYALANNAEEILITDTDRTFNRKESMLSRFSSSFDTAKLNSFVNYFLSSQYISKDFTTTHKADIRRPLITKFEKVLSSDGQNLVNVLHTIYSENRDFEDNINTAMRAAFGDDFECLVFPPAADQLIQLRIRWKSLKREQSMFDLSDGTIRFLFLMTILCHPEPPALIAIDEPETGLHPSMFPIIAEYAAEASKRTQVIFSTHSPQFLDAFSDFAVTTTVTNWRDGETTVKNLDGDTLKKWLEHYKLGSLFLSGDLEALA